MLASWVALAGILAVPGAQAALKGQAAKGQAAKEQAAKEQAAKEQVAAGNKPVIKGGETAKASSNALDDSLAAAAAPPGGAASPLVAILCYHDISNKPSAPAYTVSADTLRAHIRRCKAAGWRFLSLSELLSYRNRPAKLPPRVIVLTFDDGYRSFIKQALPILRKEKVKAAIAIVSSFIDAPPPGLDPVMTWDEIREAEQSGLVEVISHSHALHGYDTSNPQGDSGPSVSIRRYRADDGRYEDREEYTERIRVDLWASQRVLTGQLGRGVSVLAWPYGEHNATARSIAAAEGFPVTLALGGTAVTVEDLRSGCLPRVMVFGDMAIGADDLEWLFPPRQPVRAAQVDLDDLFSQDPVKFRDKVMQAVEDVKRIGATHVFLQACPDLAGDGLLEETYFMNHQVPARVDIWSLVAYEFSYADLKVWIRAPSMNLSWQWKRHPEWRIPFHPERQQNDRVPRYYRVSPELPGVRKAAIDFYSDLAIYLPIEGVLFDDDATMLAGEGLARTYAADPAGKAEAIDSLLGEIRKAVRAWRPYCKFGRTVYAQVVQRDGVHPDYAQDLTRVLADHDLVVIPANPRQEKRMKDPKAWVKALARRAVLRWSPPEGREREAPPVMLVFQTYDWGKKKMIPARELANLAKAAQKEGIQDLGVNPLAPEGGELPDRLLGADTRDGHRNHTAD